MIREWRSLFASCLVGLVVTIGGASAAAGADVSVDAVVVEPASPGPSTLCRLKVRLKNGGVGAISNFRFGVKIGGQDVAVYKNQSYAANIDAGKTDELALYSFYAPAAPNAFDVQVTLLEAEWVQVKKEASATTTTPTGPVAGLPVSASTSIKMSGGK